eukprot:COSAG03_NODE_9906_length_686_cov_1.671210_2_plen_63_part_01
MDNIQMNALTQLGHTSLRMSYIVCLIITLRLLHTRTLSLCLCLSLCLSLSVSLSLTGSICLSL